MGFIAHSCPICGKACNCEGDPFRDDECEHDCDRRPAAPAPTAEGPREGIQQLAWNIAKKWGFNRYDRILNEMVPTSEAMNALAEMTAAALERAAHIAEEYPCRHIACDCEETIRRIAAEIRKLAKSL